MERERLIVSLAISGISLTLAVSHVLWPEARIDGVTLALAGIAVLPWLGPILKSVDLPGGVKLEYRERLQRVEARVEVEERRVAQLDARVSTVERLFEFSGQASEELRRSLNAALDEYATFLEELGLRWVGELPRVHVAAPGDALARGALGWYDQESNLIVLSDDAAADPDIARREFTHRLLYDPKGELSATGSFSRGEAEMVEIESAIADYLPCSYKDDPHFAPLPARRDGRDAVDDLSQVRRFDALTGEPRIERRFEAGRVWASALWEVRKRLGAPAADRLVVSAWLTTPVTDDFGHEFVIRLSSGQKQAAEVLAIFAERGKRVPAPRL